MSVFSTLVKYELKKQFPTGAKKSKRDIAGFVLSFLITALIVGMFVAFMSIIAKNYVAIKVDKIFDPTARSYEILNLFYSGAIVIMTVICLEHMRRTLTDKTDKKLLLRLPVKQQTLFLSKFFVLLLQNYIVSFLFVVAINTIVFLVTTQTAIFWFYTFLVWLVLPIIVFLFASIFIVPYIKLIELIKNRYSLMFLLLTLLLCGLFVLYVMFLGVVQGYIQTGYIKFLFNEKFITTMQNLTLFTYPANCLSGIMLGIDILKSVLVVLGCVVLSGFLIYFVSKKLFYLTFYKDEKRKFVFKKIKTYKPLSATASLIKKEFISVWREPKYIFSYLVIATAMPVMAYSCYTLFETLIYNMLGLKIAFPLAVFIVLIFSVLTNTFCSTNITREGIALLKQKTLPIKASKILSAKVIFCLIVSLLSVVITSALLIALTSLNIWGGLLCMLIGAIFSSSQIFVATRLDLASVNLSLTKVEIDKQSTSTITKVVAIGLTIALIVGVSSILAGVLAQGVLIGANVVVHSSIEYIVPVVVCLCYFGLAIWYYYRKVQKAFDNVSK